MPQDSDPDAAGRDQDSGPLPTVDDALRRFTDLAYRKLASAGRGVFGTADDTRQIARGAVWRAFEKSDPTRAEWPGYMARKVVWEAQDIMRRDWRRLPRHVQEAGKAAAGLRRAGTEPTAAAVAQAAGLTPAQAADALVVLDGMRDAQDPLPLVRDGQDLPDLAAPQDDDIIIVDDETETLISNALLKAGLPPKDGAPDPVDGQLWSEEDTVRRRLAFLQEYFTNYGDWEPRRLARTFRLVSGRRDDDLREGRDELLDRTRNLLGRLSR